MTREEAIRTLQFGEWWDFLSGEIGDYAESTLCEALNLAIAALREQEERRWIPVTERLPDKNGEYICRHGFNGNTDIKFTGVLEYYATDEKPHWQHDSIGLIVTYWMPLPEPPKEDAQ